MSNRHYIGMLTLALVAGLVALISPAAAIFPALCMFVIGFDAIAMETRRAETVEQGSAAKP